MRVLLLVAIFAWPTVAHAQPEAEETSDPSEEEARARFTAGRIAFADGRYEDALSDFERSYALSGKPELLYNIGAAADRLRRDEEALEAFERFLEEMPDHPSRSEVQRRVSLLRESIAERQRLEATQEPEESSSGPGPAPWIVVGISGAVAVAGGVMLGVALADRAAIEGLEVDTPWPEIEAQYDRVAPLSTAGMIALGVGMAGVTAGIVWAIAGGDGGEASVALSPTGVIVRGRL